MLWLWLRLAVKLWAASLVVIVMAAIMALMELGEVVAYSSTPGYRQSDIFILDTTRHLRINLTKHPANDFSPTWSPDGTRLAFVSDRAASNDIYVMDVFTGRVKPLVNEPTTETWPRWSPDGCCIAFVAEYDGFSEDVYVLDLASDTIRNLTHDPYRDRTPTWSPDSRYLTFTSWRGGDCSQIYVVEVESGETEKLTESEQAGAPRCALFPVFAPDGSAIAFNNLANSPDLFLLDLKQKTTSNLTGQHHTHGFYMPIWSQDMSRIAFVGADDLNIYLFNLDSLSAAGLVMHPSRNTELAWMPKR